MKFKDLLKAFEFIKRTKEDLEYSSGNFISNTNERVYNQAKTTLTNLESKNVEFMDLDFQSMIANYNNKVPDTIEIVQTGNMNLKFYKHITTFGRVIPIEHIENFTFYEHTSMPLTISLSPSVLPYTFTTVQGERYTISWNYQYNALLVSVTNNLGYLPRNTVNIIAVDAFIKNQYSSLYSTNGNLTVRSNALYFYDQDALWNSNQTPASAVDGSTASYTSIYTEVNNVQFYFLFVV